LELLDNFKATVQSIASQTAKVNDAQAATHARERRRYETAVEEQKKQLTAAIADAEAAFESAKAAGQAKYAKRKAWIGRAYQASKEQGLHKVDGRLGACKYELQKKMLQAEKDRDAGLAATHSKFQQFQKDLTVEQAAMAKLEGEARRAFAAYGAFQRLFFRAYETMQVEASGEEQKILSDLREKLS